MTTRISAAPLVLAASCSLSGCAAVEAIVKAGAWTGAIMMLLFLAVLGAVTVAMRR